MSCGENGNDVAIPGEFYGNWQRFKWENVFKGEPVIWGNFQLDDDRYIVSVDENNYATVYGGLHWGAIEDNRIFGEGMTPVTILKISPEVIKISWDIKVLPDDNDYQEYAMFRGTQIYTYGQEQFAYNENGKWYSIEKIPLSFFSSNEDVEKADDIDVEHCWSECIVEYFEKVE